MPSDPLTTNVISAIGAWVWDRYAKLAAEKTVGAVRGRWERFKWKDAAELYRAKIKRLYGTMQIMGMATSVPLDNIFTDAYMLDKPTALMRFDIERLKQMSVADPTTLPQAPRINGLQLVVEKESILIDKVFLSLIPIHKRKDRNLFILGKPGAGKTTFLKYIALKSADQLINKVPIFVSLKQWADSGSDLMTFIADRFDICDFPEAQPFVEELLKSGSAIVLFDGLDEVNQVRGQRHSQTRQMNNFVEKYDKTQCLITCRIAASDYYFEGFTYVEIADFTEHQIETFVANWFRNNEGERDIQISSRFLSEYRKGENKGLRDLARTPLLLTLLCLAFNETLTFPQRRVEIYEEALDALLKKWDASRMIERDEVYRKLSVGHKENLFARIAAETFEQNEYFIPQDKLEKLITGYVKNVPPHDTNEITDGEAILRAIEFRHGIIVGRAREVYSFSHLTFQEYFTAKYIVANAEKGTVTNLAREHFADVRWREVFLLTTSLLPDASQFLRTFRLAADELVRDDEGLLALLNWAARKSALIPVEPWLIRPYYLYIDLYYGARTRSLMSVLERAVDFDRARAGSLDLDIDRALDLDLALARALASARDPDVDVQRASARAKELGLQGLATRLESLSFAYGWREFPHKLRALISEYRDIGREWNLTEEQEARLCDFLRTSRLIEDCLNLATMPPDEKRAILDSLYVLVAD